MIEKVIVAVVPAGAVSIITMVLVLDSIVAVVEKPDDKTMFQQYDKTAVQIEMSFLVKNFIKMVIYTKRCRKRNCGPVSGDIRCGIGGVVMPLMYKSVYHLRRWF